MLQNAPLFFSSNTYHNYARLYENGGTGERISEVFLGKQVKHLTIPSHAQSIAKKRHRTKRKWVTKSSRERNTPAVEIEREGFLVQEALFRPTNRKN
ncbi:hypothetical protein CEXT_752061 [Caerostris extrusa]|uniref:Uncharacterized protein n=1 Tax=Caerostris extrusa TaxID=172846 RepID=A0AAV4Y9P6_CAEEX|nr:hypothetical protein CEXT_752061 [Caerostris extrusa]